MEFSTKTVIAIRNLLVSEIKQQLMDGAKIDACEVEQSLRQVVQEIGRETLSQVFQRFGKCRQILLYGIFHRVWKVDAI